jgi:predicted Fe-S protein YdhL (DUF1289 family)
VADEKDCKADPETTPPRDGEAPAQRLRRRARPQRVFDPSVPSPCIAVCQVDPRSDLCIGCRRHIDEIRDWPIMTAEQKRAVLAALPARR